MTRNSQRMRNDNERAGFTSAKELAECQADMGKTQNSDTVTGPERETMGDSNESPAENAGSFHSHPRYKPSVPKRREWECKYDGLENC